ncbi:MAG TPA: 5-formyltetrahydrofolate cyclo-ligase [Kofleriaceae bacterium]|nr:5-formyltetrahydrofolate cyclo-ligase [Kofleriaceae bacterium]
MTLASPLMTASPSPPSPSATKPELRAWARALRDAVPAAERAAAAAAIARIVDDELFSRLAAGDVVALFAAMGSELDLRDLDVRARARGLRVAYPRVVRRERPLRFHLARLDELRVATFGVPEPDPSAAPVATEAIAQMIMPGLAFTAAGARLGWGAGHYDATLAHAHVRSIGVTLALLVVDALPEGPHDRRVDVVVTERGLVRDGGGGGGPSSSTLATPPPRGQT